jgi:hypothetical protein
MVGRIEDGAASTSRCSARPHVTKSICGGIQAYECGRLAEPRLGVQGVLLGLLDEAETFGLAHGLPGDGGSAGQHQAEQQHDRPLSTIRDRR